ncbi:MAG: hypothetical protein LKCHEGNO_01541 [Burkholderiaceae bacterium]|nr:hypothetical protein [Burkholderiaceae bacterium]
MQLERSAHWRTDRIDLFLLKPQHVDAAYVAWLNDPLINRYLESRFVVHTLDSTRAFVQRCLDSPQTLFLGVRSSALAGRHVGNIKLAPIDARHGLGEIGILIGDRSAWGQGLASDAIAALANIAKHQLGLRKLTAGCYASNVGSRKAFAKAGFETEGERRAHFLLDGHPETLMLMARWLD